MFLYRKHSTYFSGLKDVFRIQATFTVLFLVYFTIQYIVLKDEPFWKIFYLSRVFTSSLFMFHVYACVCIIILRTSSKWLKGFGSTLLLLSLIIYVIQLFSYYLCGSYLFPAALLQLEAVIIYFSWLRVGIFVVVILLSFLLYYWINDRNQSLQKTSPIKLVFFSITVIILLQICLFAAYYSTQKVTREYALKFNTISPSPELSFIETLSKFLDTKPTQLPRFTNEERLFLSSLNLPTRSDNMFPFEKMKMYGDTIKYSKRRKVSTKNVIIFFVESLSARFIGCYDTTFPGLTPNLNSFAMQSLIVDGYVNHATPTINGLRGQLFSIYPQSTNSDFGNQKPDVATMKGLPHFLNENGYLTEVLSYEEKGALINTAQIFKDAGYSSILNKEALKKKYNYLSTDYLTDKEMIDATIKQLHSFSNSEPFLLTVTTVGTHIGNALPPNCKKYAHINSPLLHLFHDFDSQFGIFWDDFKKSKYFDNTIVVVTADHSYYPSSELNQLTKNAVQTYYDKIAFLIYDPEYGFNSRMSVQRSSVDFAPTILHLLHIPESKNSFLGTSIFSSPAKCNYVWCGGVDDIYRYNSRNNTLENVPFFEKSSLTKWLQFQSYLLENNRIFGTEN